jgi:glyoxylase-like metal-dependent hydrolase (beta-lactamase superfamily II)
MTDPRTPTGRARGRTRGRAERAGLLAAAALAAVWIASAPLAPAQATPLAPAGYFHVYTLDPQTYVISEPKYWQENVSYLLLGTREALLFDTGPGLYSIRAVVRGITRLPVLVIPSHLHFDHVGDLQEFDNVRLLDTPALRAQVHGGYFVEPPSQYLLRARKRYRVKGWIADGASIDLGGRVIQFLSTPGHTPDSVSLIDAGHDRLYTGDIVNRVVTLVDVPGSDVQAMAASLQRLLALSPPDAPAYEAHSEQPLQPAELKLLAAGIADIAAGRAHSKPMCLAGIPMQRFDVGEFPIVLPTASGALLRPLGSATETLDWLGGACPAQP